MIDTHHNNVGLENTIESGETLASNFTHFTRIIDNLEKEEQDMDLYFDVPKMTTCINFVAHVSDLNVSITAHILFAVIIWMDVYFK